MFLFRISLNKNKYIFKDLFGYVHTNTIYLQYKIKHMKRPSTFLLEETIIPELKKIATSKDRSVNYLVNEALQEFIKKNKKK